MGVLIGACPLLIGTSAQSAGLALRWDQCYGDGGAINRNFACDTNAGTNVLIGSFVLSHDPIELESTEFTVNLAAAGGSWPSWWAFKNAGTCRQSSFVLDYVIPPTAVECPDWASGQAAGSNTFVIASAGPNTAQIHGANSIPFGIDNIFAGQEYFAFRIRIDDARTVGSAACSGCEVPICVVFSSLKATDRVDPGNPQIMSVPFNGTDSHYATWQGGGTPVTPRGTGCPAATPTRRETWGAVKALYR